MADSFVVGCTCDLLCAHASVALRRFVNSANMVTFTWQCLECGSRLGDIKARLIKGNRDAIPLFDRSLREGRRSGWVALRAVAVDDYAAYLASDQWRQNREQAIQRSGGVCEFCRQRPVAQVHHLHYQTLGQERPRDIVACCEPCHRIADECRETNRCPAHGTDIRAAGQAVKDRLSSTRHMEVRV